MSAAVEIEAHPTRLQADEEHLRRSVLESLDRRFAILGVAGQQAVTQAVGVVKPGAETSAATCGARSWRSPSMSMPSASSNQSIPLDSSAASKSPEESASRNGKSSSNRISNPFDAAHLRGDLLQVIADLQIRDAGLCLIGDRLLHRRSAEVSVDRFALENVREHRSIPRQALSFQHSAQDRMSVATLSSLQTGTATIAA
ncbi:hypothetical protein XH99_08810 [Bradyrhizobium nanningense]|uniref:Uncharacterized protein n=1 Tax=Bradyrhizobium nanningense TaxID=1325118 RepID=A0A4Q0SBW3_9BRAD|nr:hypothetical protein XH99_08810 [Bradyrhizobium nanningense]RXH36084.1 hypothetical protein XH84_02275 [Bradyrhizobium nanningense]TQF30841.1 hypothetical protein UNPA324_15395 [Bradyrhizobium sp. UNPA324]